jgi:hypothetical protein
MKRDFLKGLGIEDKEIIDKILDENSADIGKAKGENSTYLDQIDGLEQQLKDRDEQLKELKKSNTDNDKLLEKINQLEADNKKATDDYTSKITAMQKAHAIENGVRDSKAKTVKAVMAMLDLEKIEYKDGQLTGLTEQLDGLKKGEDTSYLFNLEKPAPRGTEPNSPPNNGGTPPTSSTFAEAIAKALNK